MKSKILSPILLLVASMIWGFAFAAQDAASEVGAFTLGFARSLIAGVFLIFVIIMFDRAMRTERKLFSRGKIDITKYELIGGVICGTVLALASAFQQIGINRGTDGGKAAFITALYVVVVPIYSLLLKKRAPLNVWISVGIAAVGFYLLCIKNDLTVSLSDLLVVACSLIFPIHILAIDHFSPRCDGVRMSMVQFFTAAFINLLIALFTERGAEVTSVFDNILPILFLGIGSSGIAYTLQIIGQKGVNPSAAAIILSLESVFGVVGTAMFLGQTLSVREYIGCGVVLIAVILSEMDFKSFLKNKNAAE